jgi:ribonuclease Z
MRAKNVLLTHFSQRYPKIPNLEYLSSEAGMNVGIAFDLMQIKKSQFQRLIHFASPLNALFKEDDLTIAEDIHKIDT